MILLIILLMIRKISFFILKLLLYKFKFYLVFINENNFAI